MRRKKRENKSSWRSRRMQEKEGESTAVLPRGAGSLYTKRELYYDARGSEKGEA